MRAQVRLGLLLALAQVVLAWGASLTVELESLIDIFSQHRRTADGYLRTGNQDLGAIEIERLAAQWSRGASAVQRSVEDRSDVGRMLAEVGLGIAHSLAAAERGDFGLAQQSLEHAALALRQWRLAHGVRHFSDCIMEVGAAHAPLDRYRVEPPDLASAAIAQELVAAATAAEMALRKCDAEASAGIRNLPEFRRLVDGMIGSLRQVPDAVSRRDPAYLHRLLIEQRSFERLLAFRFG